MIFWRHVIDCSVPGWFQLLLLLFVSVSFRCLVRCGVRVFWFRETGTGPTGTEQKDIRELGTQIRPGVWCIQIMWTLFNPWRLILVTHSLS